MALSMRLPSSSLFFKCAAIMAVTTVTVVGAMGAKAIILVDSLVETSVIEQAEKLAVTKADAILAPLRFDVGAKIDEVLIEALAAAGEIGQGAVVVDAEGGLKSQQGDAPVVDGLAALARDAVQSGAPQRGAQGAWLAVPVRAGAEEAPLGALAIGLDIQPAREALRSDKIMIAAVGATIFAAMMGIATLLLRSMIGKPLVAIQAAVERVRGGDYDTAVPLTGRRDEFGVIAKALDDMQSALAAGRETDVQRQAQNAAQLQVVQSLGQGLDALARGLLDRRLMEEFPAEYEALRTNFNRAVESLNATIAAVDENARSIRNGAEEIAKASDDLSRRTETQAATLEQTAAALDEMLSSVKAAAENAENADKATGEARRLAARNDDVMRSAMTAMAEIEKSSEQIGEIITVIDDIAFQTNLLALNAGVEAARAGSSGKGFAVVASEVRALAQRSSDAARQIKDLITGSTEQVKTGVHLVEESGSALEAVVSQVTTISELVADIARSAAEQAQGLNEINVGMGNLDQVTQQNAAMVEQSTAAAHMLRNEAGALTDLVSRFTVAAAAARGGKPDVRTAIRPTGKAA